MLEPCSQWNQQVCMHYWIMGSGNTNENFVPEVFSVVRTKTIRGLNKFLSGVRTMMRFNSKKADLIKF